MAFWKRRGEASKAYIRRMNEKRNVECPICFRLHFINFGEERILRMKAEWHTLKELIAHALKELELVEQLYEAREADMAKGHEGFVLADRLHTDTEAMLKEIKKLKGQISKEL